MPSRRDALKSLALGAGALIVGRVGDARAHLAPAPDATPAAAPAPMPAPAGPFTLPALSYAFDALEPHLDAQTMQIHHDKHHAAYVANLNKAVVGKPELASRTVESLLRGLESLPADVRTAVRNHGGGHANHTLLWTSLARDGAHAPKGELAGAIDRSFGSFSQFQDQFNAAAMGVFGSGWAWLAASPKGALSLLATPNQDTPLSQGLVPLLGIDVWEHAYYLKFQNRRAEYVAAFAKVVDWDAISARFAEASKG